MNNVRIIYIFLLLITSNCFLKSSSYKRLEAVSSVMCFYTQLSKLAKMLDKSIKSLRAGTAEDEDRPRDKAKKEDADK